MNVSLRVACTRLHLPEKKRAIGLDLDAMRTAIAAAMARSKREIPHYYLEHQVDVTPAEQWIANANATRAPDDRLLFGAVAIKCVAMAVRRFPVFNGFYRDGKFEPRGRRPHRCGHRHPRRRARGAGAA